MVSSVILYTYGTQFYARNDGKLSDVVFITSTGWLATDYQVFFKNNGEGAAKNITVAHSSDGGATSTLINAGNAIFHNSVIKNGKDQFYNPPNMLIYWDGSDLFMM